MAFALPASGSCTETACDPAGAAEGTAPAGDIAVPSVLGERPVTRIGDHAFAPDDETLANDLPLSVALPDSVTGIGAVAFEYCLGLTSMALPAGVAEVGFQAFRGVPLETLYVPASWAGGDMLAEAWVREECEVVYAALELGADSRAFTSDAANNKELEVAGNVPWTATAGATWLTLKKASGTGSGVVVYNVAENTGRSARTGTITVGGGGLKRTFTVTQEGFVERLELGGNVRTFPAVAAASKELGVSANVSWTAKTGVSWLTLRKGSGTGNGTIVYDVAANTGSGLRTGTITVTGGGLTRTFTAMQEGAQLALAGSYRTFTADAANSKELEVVANVSWTATADVAWLTVKKTSGTGNGTIVYNVAANTGSGSRKGKITVAGGGLTRILSVTQKGPGEKAETQEAPVGVPCLWLEKNATGILEENGGNYEAAAKAKAANGRAVWECYVAELDPTETGTEFKVKSISFVNGEPVVEWNPDLNESGTTNVRAYTVEGKSAMTDAWGPFDASSRFFRVRVGMPAE